MYDTRNASRQVAADRVRRTWAVDLVRDAGLWYNRCMTMSERITSEALTLPPGDRLELIEQLWDSLAADPEALELTSAQRRELDGRIDEMDAEPDAGIPWERIKAERRHRQ